MGLVTDEYQRLAKTLRATRLSGNALTPYDFFEALNAKAPRLATHATVWKVKSSKVLGASALSSGNPEFSHWRNLGKKKDGTPTPVFEDNKRTTKLRFGSAAQDVFASRL